MGFGCGGLSGILNAPLSHEAGCSVIKEAFQRGITFFDTVDIYGDHHNEIMVGKVLLLSNHIERKMMLSSHLACMCLHAK